MTENQIKLIDEADVREVKLIDGTSVIAEIIGEDETNILLYDPLQVVLDHTTAMFVPWFITSTERYIPVAKNKTVASSGCTFDMKATYFQAIIKQRIKAVMEDTPETYEFYEDMEPGVLH